jgi:hypothetical protein
MVENTKGNTKGISNPGSPVIALPPTNHITSSSTWVYFYCATSKDQSLLECLSNLEGVQSPWRCSFIFTASSNPPLSYFHCPLEIIDTIKINIPTIDSIPVQK